MSDQLPVNGEQGSVPRQNTTFPSGGGNAHGYLAVPRTDSGESGTGPAVVVIQEWWGLTSYMADVVDRLASEGFVALAPDLYGGMTTHDAGEAAQLMRALPVEQATRELAGAVDFLLEHPSVSSSTVGALGFCMGGGFVLTLAAQQGAKVGAAVPYYAVLGDELPDFSGVRAEIQGHWAEKDHNISVDEVERLAATIRQQSGKRPEFHVYPANHGFHNDQNPQVYDPDQATLAWDRTLRFLRRHLA